MEEPMSDYGRRLIEQARRNHQLGDDEDPPAYKPCKTRRRLWRLPHYAKMYAHREGMTAHQAERLLNVFFELVREVLLRGDIVHLGGIGYLYVMHRAARCGFGDPTGEYGYIPESASVVFRVSPWFRHRLSKRAKYFARFNDNPMLTRYHDVPERTQDPGWDLEAFIVAQGWEDEQGVVQQDEATD